LYDEYGAFLDRQIVDDFFNYAAYVIQRWDAYVDTWITFNEVQWCNSQFQFFPFGSFWPKYHDISVSAHQFRTASQKT
jgi:WD repeat-containing protein 26